MTDTSSTTKWEPYWNETYKMYYWYNGKESVWETPEGEIPPPPPTSSDNPATTTHDINQHYNSYLTTITTPPVYASTSYTDPQSELFYEPPATKKTMAIGKKIVGQETRDLRQMYHYFDYNAWCDELNKNDANKKKKVKLTKKELDAIKRRKEEKKRKFRSKWLLDD